MDLHDYKDVAENYDRYLEVMFETNNAHEGFQEFYLELAKRHGQNGVVDIACGTGAVLNLLISTVITSGRRPDSYVEIGVDVAK